MCLGAAVQALGNAGQNEVYMIGEVVGSPGVEISNRLVEGIGGAGVDSNLYVCFVQLQTNGSLDPVVERGNTLTAKDRAQAEFETTTV